LEAAAEMHHGRVVAFDSTLALDAARISVDSKLPLADSVVLATARAHDAVLWTQDADFKGMDNVKYVPKRP
jgi:predicted nucleic acid-binding protein